jgi:hypothetical protein
MDNNPETNQSHRNTDALPLDRFSDYEGQFDEFFKEQIRFEHERAREHRKRIMFHSGLVSFLIGGLGYQGQFLDYSIQFPFGYLFAFTFGVGVICLIFQLWYLSSAWHRKEYGHFDKPSDIYSSLKRSTEILEEMNEDTARSRAKDHVKANLSRLRAAIAEKNNDVNNTRDRLLRKSRGCFFISLCLLGISFIFSGLAAPNPNQPFTGTLSKEHTMAQDESGNGDDGNHRSSDGSSRGSNSEAEEQPEASAGGSGPEQSTGEEPGPDLPTLQGQSIELGDTEYERKSSEGNESSDDQAGTSNGEDPED